MAFRISTKKHERIITRKITKTYCYVTGYFYVTASLRIFKKEKYEHQMFSRCQHEMTSIFLLVDITKCFSPRHGNTHVRM